MPFESPVERQPRRSIAVEPLLHAAVWLGLAVLFALQAYSTEILERGQARFVPALVRELARWGAWALVSPLVFIVARRAMPERLTMRGAAVLLAVAPVAIVLRTTVAVGLGMALSGSPNDVGFDTALMRALRGRFALDFFIYAGIVAVYTVRMVNRAAVERLRHTARLESLLARARIEAFEAQLHPHFLFNMLHGVSALLDTDVRLARRMLVQFADLLRMTLDAKDTPEVPLLWDVRFAEQYLEIQAVRFPDRLTFAFEVDPAARGAFVPRLMLQPLVENAIRHGVERSMRPVHITVRAAREGDRVIIAVDDTGPGPRGPSADGIGLATTRARLASAFGNRATLRIEARPEGGTSAVVELPFHEASNVGDL